MNVTDVSDKDGTNGLLDGLDEGIIILDERTGVVQFANQSAQNLSVRIHESFSL